MPEIVSNRFKSLQDDMSNHVDRMEGLIGQLRSMGNSCDEDIAIGILVASVEIPELLPVTASIKKLADPEISWKEVANRGLMEDVKTMTSNSGLSRSSNAALSTCQIYR